MKSIVLSSFALEVLAGIAILVFAMFGAVSGFKQGDISVILVSAGVIVIIVALLAKSINSLLRG